MKQYIAKLVFRVNTGEKKVSEFDEQYRIIRSVDLADAFFKARSLGRQEEGFVSGSGIAWEFIDVEELFEVDAVKDGGQLFSTTHNDEDSHSFVEYIKRKAMAIQAKNLTFA